MTPKLAIGAGLILSLVSGAGGWKLRDADYQRHLKEDARAQAKAQQKVTERVLQKEAVSADVREDRDTKREANRSTTQIIYREVPKYVTRTVFEDRLVAAGGLPAGFVWSFNQSASGDTTPLPARLSPDTPTGVDLSTVATVTAGNAELYRSCKADLEAWGSWYAKLTAQVASQTKE